MPNWVLQNILKVYLGIFISSGSAIIEAAFIPDAPNGIYTKLCGSGQLFFIPFEDENNREPEPQHLTACHAICANKEREGEDEA